MNIIISEIKLMIPKALLAKTCRVVSQVLSLIELYI